MQFSYFIQLEVRFDASWLYIAPIYLELIAANNLKSNMHLHKVTHLYSGLLLISVQYLNVNRAGSSDSVRYTSGSYC